jgi:hypothetical protein
LLLKRSRCHQGLRQSRQTGIIGWQAEAENSGSVGKVPDQNPVNGQMLRQFTGIIAVCEHEKLVPAHNPQTGLFQHAFQRPRLSGEP